MGLKKSVSKGLEKVSHLPVIGALFKPKDKIAVIRLSGVIADGMRGRSVSYAKYKDSIEDAFDLHKLKAVALVINSPGGAPGQSALVAHLIRQLSEDHDIPVLAFIEDVAASGGYWLACAADEIYAQSVSIVGSIGVISAGFGFQDLIERYGVERRVHISGKDKGFLDPFQAEKPADVKRLKTIQSDIHEEFIDWVKSRRGDKLDGQDKELFEGQFWTGNKAKQLGIIDDLGELKSICEARFGDNLKFIDCYPGAGFIASLLGQDTRFSLGRDMQESLEEKALWARFGL